MRRLLLLLPLLLAACAPVLERPPEAMPPATAAPGVLTVKDDAGRIFLNTDLGLFAPEGSVLFFQQYRGAESESAFTHPWPFEKLLFWLKAELKRLGWRLIEAYVWEKPPTYQAKLILKKGSERRVVVLRLENGRYHLSVQR
jgi:hypothetical protein